MWFGLNSITEKFWYNDETSKTMRLIVSAPTDNPIVWSVTKIENTKPVGLQKLTLYQDRFDEHTDYIERDENGRIIAMYADYFDSNLEPIDQNDPMEPDLPVIQSGIYSQITASNFSIKVGGSYKTLHYKVFDIDDDEVTQSYSDATFEWTCSVDGEDITDKVTWLNGSLFNQKKIKFPDDRSYLNKILEIKCVVTTNDVVAGNTEISTTALFELISS